MQLNGEIITLSKPPAGIDVTIRNRTYHLPWGSEHICFWCKNEDCNTKKNLPLNGQVPVVFNYNKKTDSYEMCAFEADIKKIKQYMR